MVEQKEELKAGSGVLKKKEIIKESEKGAEREWTLYKYTIRVNDQWDNFYSCFDDYDIPEGSKVVYKYNRTPRKDDPTKYNYNLKEMMIEDEGPASPGNNLLGTELSSAEEEILNKIMKVKQSGKEVSENDFKATVRTGLNCTMIRACELWSVFQSR